MTRILIFAIAAIFCTPAFADIALLPHVGANADLLAAKSTAYPIIVRDGFTAAGDVSPLSYKASNLACPLSAGNGDNGSQVKSADSKCWLASFPADPVDIRQWGAKCDGATDDSAALIAADAATGFGSLGVLKTCRLSNNVSLVHSLYIGPQGALSIDNAKTLTISGVASDAATPFLGAGTIAEGVSHQIVRNLKSLTLGASNWVDTPACSSCTVLTSPILAVLGSAGTPDTTTSPAMVVQKTLGAATGGPTYAALYASLVKTQSVSGQSARALFAETYDNVGWTGGATNFTEGARIYGHCGTGVNAATCFTEGVTAVAWNESTSNGVVIGVEAEADSNFPHGSVLDPSAFTAAFVATSGSQAGTVHIDAGYLINPNNPAGVTPTNGFYCPVANPPGSSVVNSCFKTDSPSLYSLDAHLVSAGNGNIWLPNNTSLMGTDNSVLTPRRLVTVSTGNDALFGYDDAYATVQIGTPGAAKPVIIDGPQVLRTLTVGTLPACAGGTAGWMFLVSDAANGSTYAGTLAGGGGLRAIVICDGSNWTTH